MSTLPEFLDHARAFTASEVARRNSLNEKSDKQKKQIRFISFVVGSTLLAMVLIALSVNSITADMKKRKKLSYQSDVRAHVIGVRELTELAQSQLSSKENLDWKFENGRYVSEINTNVTVRGKSANVIILIPNRNTEKSHNNCRWDILVWLKYDAPEYKKYNEGYSVELCHPSFKES